MEVLGDRSVIYQLEVYKKWYEEQQEEIERLNNIINKIIDILEDPYNQECINQNKDIIKKIQELKGSVKSD